jgi:hypothetical protein
MKDLEILHSEEVEKSTREVISDKTEPYEQESFEKYYNNIFSEQVREGTFQYTDNDG